MVNNNNNNSRVSWLFTQNLTYLKSRLQCTGYGLGNGSAYLANVQTIAYDTSYVYIQASGIPSYR